MDDTTFHLAYDHLKDLHKICSSDYLSLAALQEKIDALDESDIEYISQVLDKEESEDLDEDYPLLHTVCRFLHYACTNKNITLEIVKYLLDTFPNTKMNEWSTSDFCPNYATEAYPLHLACCNKDCPNEVIMFLVEHYPPALKHLCIVDQGINPSHPDFYIQGLPLHFYLTRTSNVDIDTVKMMVEAYPQCLTTVDRNWQCYPIHLALSEQHYIDLEIVKYFLELEPASIRLVNGDDATPLHLACYNGHLTLEIYQFILNAWPEAIHMRTDRGYLPLHHLCCNENLDDYVSLEVLQYMISIDPMLPPGLPLHVACGESFTEQLDVVKILYDSYPEALFVQNGDGRSPLCLARDRGSKWQPIVSFFEEQLVHAQTAKDSTAMHTLDNNGWLPLHHAVKDNIPLGSIKLLVEGNPSAIRTADGHMAFPLHIACEFSSVKVVKYLVKECFSIPMSQLDTNKDSIVHYACRGGNFEVVKYLLTNHASLVSSAEINGNGDLPLHLLCKAGKYKVDSEDYIYLDTMYIETIWLMLLANPEAVVTRGLR